MSTARGAKLKAQYNRVRTSTALRANDMWTNTIGVSQDPQAGSNAAIEASIYAPTHGGGSAKRAERRALAQQVIEATGYQPSVTDYQGLLTLAKEQGSLGAGTRGACKLCGGMGHLTKQCTNFLTGHNAVAGVDVVGGAAVGAAAGASGAHMGLLPAPEDLEGLSDLSSSSSSGSDTDSDSASASDSDRERRRAKKRKRSSKDEGGSKKSKKTSSTGRKKSKKSKKSKKNKKSRKE